MTMRYPNRKIRLHSASSKPSENATFRCKPCSRFRTAAWYVGWVIIVALVLMLNNIVLMYVQQYKDSGNDKLPAAAYSNGRHIIIERDTPQTNSGSESQAIPPTVAEEFGKTSWKRKRNEIKPVTKKANNITKRPYSTVKIPLDKSTPNELLRQSAILLTNIGSSCQLEKTIKSFLVDFADVPIYLERTESTSYLCDHSSRHRLKTIHCIVRPHACAKACLYNHITNIIKRAEIPYVFVWDTRYIYNDVHLLALLATEYMTTTIDIVSPCLDGYCNSTTGTLFYSKSKGELIPLSNTTLITSPVHSFTSCQLTEILPPVYLTKVDLLSNLQWDEHLIYGVHTDFLLNLKKKHVTSAVCKHLLVTFNGTCEQNGRVQPQLVDSWLDVSKEFMQKWNITNMYNGLGRMCKLRENNLLTCSNARWRKIDSLSSTGADIQNKVLQSINDQIPGWMFVRNKTLTTDNLSYLYTSPCAINIKGKLTVEFDRHSSLPNKVRTLDIDLVHFNRSCGRFEAFWNVTAYGKLQQKQIYYVTAVSNDTYFMRRLLQQINLQTDRIHTNLVIVDMSRPGKDQFNVSAYETIIPTSYKYLGYPFSRSIGLKTGFEFAQLLAQQRSQDDPILFAIDTSMLIPKDFTKRVRRNTRCGVSCYAPVCYKERSSGSFWVNYGYGMIGVCASDYIKSEGWDSKWGYHWGAEDVDMIKRLQHTLNYTVRIKEDNYRHSHTEETRIHLKMYYEQKNVYPDSLPIIPQTSPVTDTSLIASLQRFALKTMRYPIKLELKEIYQTTISGTSAVLYDLRFRNNINEEYYALIRSI